MTFRIQGLAPAPFEHLYGLSEAALAEQGVVRHHVAAPGTCPDRVELRDAAPGEAVLPINHVHQQAGTPFRSAHAIYVRAGARMAFDEVDVVPGFCARRTSRCGPSTPTT